jgi:hypothetical protein
MLTHDPTLPNPAAASSNGDRAATSNQQPRSQEILKRMVGGGMYEAAAREGMGLSAYLEQIDPTDRYRDGLDAYSRLLKAANIRVNSDMHTGYYADEGSKFFDTDEGRALFPEFLIRQWKRATLGHPLGAGQRALYASTDSALGGVLEPFQDTGVPRYAQLAPAVPISEVVAVTTPITGDVYRAFYLTDTAAQERLVRVAQGAELPRAKLVGADRTIRLYKYGRILEATYEIMRRMRIDLIALHVARIAIQSEVDKLATIIDILVNGDGNANTAATNYNLTTLDPLTTANNVTLTAWLALKLKLLNPYIVTTALTQSAGALKLQLLSTGSANIPLVTIQAASGFGGFTPINPELRDNVALGITADAPTGVVVAFDRRFAIERVVEIGGNIQEIIRFATRQTEGLSLSEVEGYDIFDQRATVTMTTTA